MVDINGKTIKKGMCLEILYEDDTGVGVGKIIEKSGDLGFIDYQMCRKTPCFSYGDIRHVHRIYASN